MNYSLCSVSAPSLILSQVPSARHERREENKTQSFYSVYMRLAWIIDRDVKRILKLKKMYPVEWHSLEWISSHLSSFEYYLQNIMLALALGEIKRQKSQNLCSPGAHAYSLGEPKMVISNCNIRKIVVSILKQLTCALQEYGKGNLFFSVNLKDPFTL